MEVIGRTGFIATGIVCILFACRESTVPSITGSLDLSVTTAGSSDDPDGFAILVDDLQRKALPGAGRVIIPDLDAGQHTVELDSVARNCEVTTANPLTVEVQAGTSTSLSFDVTCWPPAVTGNVEVIAHTTGTSLDQNGYSVWVDGELIGAVGIEDTLLANGLTPGDHSVELRDVASECVAPGGPSLTASVTPPDTTMVSFAVFCPTLPPARATIAVSLMTQIVNAPVPDSFTVVLDGTQSKHVPPNGSVSFGTEEGTHRVHLRTPSYCLVGGFSGAPNPQIVTVSAGAIKTVNSGVLCIP